MTTSRQRRCRTAMGIAALVVAGLCTVRTTDSHAQPAPTWEDRFRAAEIAIDEARLSDAEAALRAAIAQLEQLQQRDLRMATTLNALAIVIGHEERVTEAIAFGQRALDIRQRALGAMHPDVAVALGNLAGYHRLAGAYPESIALYLRALAIQELAVGPESSATIATVRNLAGAYANQQRYAESRPLLARVVHARERSAGTEHPLVAAELNNLAELYRLDGQRAEAEPLYLRAIAIQEKALGADHIDLAIAMTNLARLYAVQREFPRAEPLYRRVLAIRERTFGNADPALLATLDAYAAVLRALGKSGEAAAQEHRAGRIRAAQ